jgi:hypothetical protein
MKGFVYLIADINNGTYKIGVTKNTPEKRLKALQTGNSSQLILKETYECEFPYRLESMLHNHYKLVNEMNEWFYIENPQEFLHLCKEFDNIILSLKDNPHFSKNLK